MLVEFQKKGCKPKVYEALDWFNVLWLITDASDGWFFINTIRNLKTEEYAEAIKGFENQNDDLALLEWKLKNGNRYFVGIQGETLETLGRNPKYNLARLLCNNQEFLKALDLYYLKINHVEILSYCKPKHTLMHDELSVFKN